MSLILLNLQSNQQIKLDSQNPLIIGRKNVEGCFDKRVSRSHGRVTCTVDGKIRLEALHCNPCFFTRNGVPPVLQLNKDEEETLNEGDYLGLLPNAFWFKITSNKEPKIKIEAEHSNTETDQNSKENIRTSNLNESNNLTDSVVDQTVIVKTEQKCFPISDNNAGNLNPLPAPTAENSAGPSKVYGSEEFEKTRKLPLWMYEIDEVTETNGSSNKRPAPDTREKEKKQKLPETDSRNGTEVGPEKVNFPSTSKDDQGESSKKNDNKESNESDVGNEKCTAAKRPICQYESNCYRKNPQHKLEFCHPGDPDYIPYEERPVCQYGASCYRKNEKHRLEFRHPPQSLDSQNISSSSSRSSIASSPLPSKRRRKKIKTENSDYEDEDDYDLEDPFINDASSDEYIPSDYEDEEEDFNTSRDDD